VRRIIREYTREAGVRNLERAIGRVCRKVATRIAEGATEAAMVDAEDVPRYLGKPMFTEEEITHRVEVPGVAIGLAWTPTGGDVLFIEATRMPGSKGFVLTGSLGEVMRESAQAALSYVRAHAKDYGIPERFFDQSDIHIHVPAGAVPKDGPSAGITIVTALVSLLTDRPVRPDVGMTGEITLRGEGVARGGHQGEGPGGPPGGPAHRDPPEAEREGPGGHPGGRATGPAVRAGGDHRRGPAGGVAGSPGGRPGGLQRRGPALPGAGEGPERPGPHAERGKRRAGCRWPRC